MPARKLRPTNDIGGTFTDTVLAKRDEPVPASVMIFPMHADPAIGAERAKTYLRDYVAEHGSRSVGSERGV